MDYAPNVDAVTYFVSDIFPLIKKQVPDTVFIIAGQRPVKKVLQLAAPDVKVTGFVKDLSEMYASASIVVAPLRFGAGTQNKVLEAMAMGVPVVSRNIGFNGLNIVSGQGVILAMESTDFAQQCIELLQSSERRKSVGEQGMEIIHTQFDWDVIARKLEDYFLQIVKP
jgi:glycosyltransferase involved in cell wall biosynthesis